MRATITPLRPLALLGIATLLVAATAATAPAATVLFFAENASNEAILSEMALHPAAIRVGTVTYIAYQGPGYDPYIVAYDEADGSWDGPYRAGSNPLVMDAHGAPSLYLDAAGRLHVLFGGHNRKLYHSRAAIAGRIDAWEDLPYIDTVGTYPQLMESADGRVILFYRGIDHDWVMRVSDESREVFGEATTVLKAAADTWWYADFRPGSGGSVHAAFVWVDNFERATGVSWGRENAYYLHRSAEGTWTAIDGTPVELPLDHETADAQVRVFDSQGVSVNEISVKEDDEGAPCILFLTGQGFGPGAYTWTFARHEGGAWRLTPIATADHVFDSGAIDPAPGGRVEALLVVGDSGAAGGTGQAPEGRGGRIVRYVSADRGMTWQESAPIVPDESRTDFADPQYVRGGSGAARAVFVEWHTDDSLFFNRMFLWGDGGLVSRETTPVLDRIAGPARAQTAVEVSKAGFPEGARTVVLATEGAFPDALAGVPLAHDLWAPLLLTSSEMLSPGVAEEISRLGATRAVLLGGEKALAPAIESELLARTRVTTVERLAGATRYDTALEIARRLYDPVRPAKQAVVVSGENWPDAATAAPLAATIGAPILLTRASSLPTQTLAALEELETSSTIVVGGERVIEPALEAQLPSPRRLAGATRYETAVAVAEDGLENGMLPYRVLVATGLKFPDALAGATLAARLRAPVLLTQPDDLPQAVKAHVDDGSDALTRLVVLGDQRAVSWPVEHFLHKTLGTAAFSLDPFAAAP